MDPKTYLSKIEEIVGVKFEDKTIDLEFPRQTIEEARLQKSKIDRMQKELLRIKRAVDAEIDALQSTYQDRIEHVRPGFWARLSYPSAVQSRDEQKKRLAREQNSAVNPLRIVRGKIDVILFSLDMVKRRIEEEIEG